MENERLCVSVLSDYARVLRSWKMQYAPQSPAEAPDERFEEACHKLDEAEYYLDILAFGDSYERAEVVNYLLVDGRLDKLKEKSMGGMQREQEVCRVGFSSMVRWQGC